jgi:hypothetical protein
MTCPILTTAAGAIYFSHLALLVFDVVHQEDGFRTITFVVWHL